MKNWLLFLFSPPHPVLESPCSWQGGTAAAGTAVTSWHHTLLSLLYVTGTQTTGFLWVMLSLPRSPRWGVDSGDTRSLMRPLGRELESNTCFIVLSFSHCTVSSFPTGIALPAVLLERFTSSALPQSFWSQRFYGLLFKCLHWFKQYIYLSVCLSVCLSLCMSLCLSLCLSVCLSVSGNSFRPALYYVYVTFTFMHLADAFIQSDLQYIQVIHFLVSTCVPWESNPQPFRC